MTLLDRVVDAHGVGMPGWVADPLRAAGRVLRLGPATAMLDGQPLRAAATALPVATSALDGVALVLGLHRVDDVDAAFAELRRALRPAATLVVVVPSRTARSWVELRWRALLAPVRDGAWGHRSALDGAGWLLTAADFAVLGDDRVPFVLPLPDAATAQRAVEELPGCGLWPPLPEADREGLAEALARRAGPGVALPVPMRRLVARR